MIRAACVVATFGDLAWRERAEDAIRTARGQFDIWQHHGTRTLANARNTAVQLGIEEDGKRCDYFCFLDADDELVPGYADAMNSAFNLWNLWRPDDVRRNPVIFAPRVQYIHEDGTEDEPVFPNRHRPIEELNHCVIGSLFPASLFFLIGGFREELLSGLPLTIYEDWDLVLRLLAAGAQIAYVEDAIYRAHVQPGSRNQGPDAHRVYAGIRAEHVARRKALA